MPLLYVAFIYRTTNFLVYIGKLHQICCIRFAIKVLHRVVQVEIKAMGINYLFILITETIKDNTISFSDEKRISKKRYSMKYKNFVLKHNKSINYH